MCVDAHGHPIDFEITGGEVHGSQVAGRLIEKVAQATHFIADKGYDSEDIRICAKAPSMNPIIPSRRNSKKTNPEFDRHLYKLRH